MDERLLQLVREFPDAMPAELHEKLVVEFPEVTKPQIKNKMKRLRAKAIEVAQGTEDVQADPGADSVEALVAEGKLYSALRKLGLAGSLDEALERSPAALRTKIMEGVCSEVVDGSLLLREVPGKGLGYLAGKDITAGSVLLFDTAFVRTDHANSSWRNAQAALAKKAGCSDFFQAHVDTLHYNPSSVVASASEGKLMAIMDANQFECVRDRAWTALFPAASRLNHSCKPNAVLDSLRDFAVVRAVCSIKKGEEVTISYVGASELFEVRQERLLGRGFSCDCVRCAETNRSDPGGMLPCPCGATWFAVHRGSGSDGETCDACGFALNFRDARERLDRIETDVEFMATKEAQFIDPRLLVERLTKTIDFARRTPGAVPLTNCYLRTLVNHVSSCHFYVAKKGGGGPTAWAAYYQNRVLALESMEALYDGDVPPLVEYIQALHRFVNTAKWPTKQDQKKYEAKYAQACHVMFGQKTPPRTLVSRVEL